MSVRSHSVTDSNFCCYTQQILLVIIGTPCGLTSQQDDKLHKDRSSRTLIADEVDHGELQTHLLRFESKKKKSPSRAKPWFKIARKNWRRPCNKSKLILTVYLKFMGGNFPTRDQFRLRIANGCTLLTVYFYFPAYQHCHVSLAWHLDPIRIA